MRFLALLPVAVGCAFSIINNTPVEQLALILVLDAMLLAILAGGLLLWRQRDADGAVGQFMNAHFMLTLVAVYGALSLYAVVLLAGKSSFSHLAQLITNSAWSILLVLGLRVLSFVVAVRDARPATRCAESILLLTTPLVAYFWVFVLGELGVTAARVGTAALSATILIWTYYAADIVGKWPLIGPYVQRERS